MTFLNQICSEITKKVCRVNTDNNIVCIFITYFLQTFTLSITCDEKGAGQLPVLSVALDLSDTASVGCQPLHILKN